MPVLDHEIPIVRSHFSFRPRGEDFNFIFGNETIFIVDHKG